MRLLQVQYELKDKGGAGGIRGRVQEAAVGQQLSKPMSRLATF